MPEKPAAQWQKFESFKALAARHVPAEPVDSQETASDKRGLRLFYDHDAAAQVALLSEKTSGYSPHRGGLEDVQVRGFRNEPELIWELLHHPTADRADLK
ncbi:MAG: hypothetical protein PHO54_05590, partial [Candidatus Peribacteraceae bacterium]|nr:hypothetical protein [Candidatus Peribacteraceae bacterium]